MHSAKVPAGSKSSVAVWSILTCSKHVELTLKFIPAMLSVWVLNVSLISNTESKIYDSSPRTMFDSLSNLRAANRFDFASFQPFAG